MKTSINQGGYKDENIYLIKKDIKMKTSNNQGGYKDENIY